MTLENEHDEFRRMGSDESDLIMKPKKTANFKKQNTLSRQVKIEEPLIEEAPVEAFAMLKRQQTQRPSTRIIEEDELDDETSIAATSNNQYKLVRSKSLAGKSCMGEKPDYSEFNNTTQSSQKLATAKSVIVPSLSSDISSHYSFKTLSSAERNKQEEMEKSAYKIGQNEAKKALSIYTGNVLSQQESSIEVSSEKSKISNHKFSGRQQSSPNLFPKQRQMSMQQLVKSNSIRKPVISSRPQRQVTIQQTKSPIFLLKGSLRETSEIEKINQPAENYADQKLGRQFNKHESEVTSLSKLKDPASNNLQRRSQTIVDKGTLELIKEEEENPDKTDRKLLNEMRTEMKKQANKIKMLHKVQAELVEKIADQKMIMHAGIGKIEVNLKATGMLMTKFQEQLNLFDRNKIGYNFVYMFASPPYMLYKNQAGEVRNPYAPLRYRDEYISIQDSVKKARKEIIVHKVHGTFANLQDILERQRPGAIHFSGHGVTKEEIREESLKMQDFTLKTKKQIEDDFEKGDAIVLEDDNCLARYIYQTDLQELVKNTGVKLDFVFMATCHSETAAKVFLDSGAHHVIAIHRSKAIHDEAVLTFTRSFYNSLWREGSKICKSFETAKHQVEIEHGIQQAQNFILKNRHHEKKNISCQIYGNFQPGRPIFKYGNAILQDTKVPSAVNFEGYQDLKQQLISRFFSRVKPNLKRLVRIWGQAGVGKSALACNTVRYVQERSFLEGGCLYLNCVAIDDLADLKEQLCKLVLEDSSNQGVFMQKQEADDSFDDSLDQAETITTSDYTKLVDFFVRSEEVFVLLFDNTDTIMTKVKFINWIDQLLDWCPNVKVIVTCREEARLASQHELQVEVKGLINEKEAWNIFIENYGKPVSLADKKKLADTKPDRKIFHELYLDPKTRKRIIPVYQAANLEKHHFFQLLQWNPQAIKTVAALWKSNGKMTLLDLYKMLVEQKQQKSSAFSLVCGKNNEALQLSLRVQMSELKTFDDQTYSFLMLINFLPNYFSMSDFEQYWTEWNKMFTDSISSSRQSLKDIISKVLDRNMLTEQKKEGWLKQLPERRFNLVEATKVYISEESKDLPYQKIVNYFQCKNFRNQVKQFYLKYLNTNLADGINMNGSGKQMPVAQVNQIKSIKLKLENDEENLIMTAKQCFHEWTHPEPKLNSSKRVIDHAKREFSISVERKRSPDNEDGKQPYSNMNDSQSVLSNKVSARLKSEYIHKATDEFSEEFIIILMASNLLIKRNDFAKILLDLVDINLDGEPEKLYELPVSANFLGNFWRFAAIYKLREAQEQSKVLQKKAFNSILGYLKFAEDYFKRDDYNQWGLGLTYNLMARLYTILDQSGASKEENLRNASQYFKQALTSFKVIDHFRGIYMTSKDLYDLRQQYLYNYTDQKSKVAQKIDETNQKYIQQYSFFQVKFQKQQQTSAKVKTEDRILWKVCCANRSESDDMQRISLDLEIVLKHRTGSIGVRLLPEDKIQKEQYLRFENSDNEHALLYNSLLDMSKLDLSSLNESKLKKKSMLKAVKTVRKKDGSLSGQIKFQKQLNVQKKKKQKNQKDSDSDSRDLESRQDSVSTLRTVTNRKKISMKPPVSPLGFNMSLPTGNSRQQKLEIKNFTEKIPMLENLKMTKQLSSNNMQGRRPINKTLMQKALTNFKNSNANASTGNLPLFQMQQRTPSLYKLPAINESPTTSATSQCKLSKISEKRKFSTIKLEKRKQEFVKIDEQAELYERARRLAQDIKTTFYY